jgi:hypothetical protein
MVCQQLNIVHATIVVKTLVVVDVKILSSCKSLNFGSLGTRRRGFPVLRSSQIHGCNENTSNQESK